MGRAEVQGISQPDAEYTVLEGRLRADESSRGVQAELSNDRLPMNSVRTDEVKVLLMLILMSNKHACHCL